MSEPAAEESPAVAAASTQRSRNWLADWRAWVGVAITVGCIWLAMRDVPFSEVLEACKDANVWLLVGASVPAYAVSLYFRALRWRHLTRPLGEIDTSSLYRATAIGFMVNNLLPLRLGELARSYALARAARVPTAAVLGTVALERVLDAVSVLLLAIGAIGLLSANAGDAGELREGALLLLPVALTPLAAVIVLRVAPEFVLRVMGFFMKPLPEKIHFTAIDLVRSFAKGLEALRGGTHLVWIAVHSMILWLVLSTIPFLAAMNAFGIDLGSAGDNLLGAWVVLGAVGAAVALPSAPGFIGPYQLAFRIALVPLGVDLATTTALGLVCWLIFWLTFTLQGLLALRGSGLALSDLRRGADDPPRP